MLYKKTKIKFFESYEHKKLANIKFQSVEYTLKDFDKYSLSLASLIAWVMGDGSFSKEFKMVLHGQKESLLKIAKEVSANFGFNFVIKKEKIKRAIIFIF